jgi:hypothetical protein
MFPSFDASSCSPLHVTRKILLPQMNKISLPAVRLTDFQIIGSDFVLPDGAVFPLSGAQEQVD